MFKDCKTRTDQGNVGLGCAIAYFLSKGYTVSNPLTENQKYDLIVENGDNLSRVQIKTSGFIPKGNPNFEVRLSTGGGFSKKRKIYKFDKTKVEYLFVLLSNGHLYLIPSKDIHNKHSLTINPKKYKKYRVFIDSKEGSMRELENLKKERVQLHSKLEKLESDYKSLKEKYEPEDNLSEKQKEFHKKARKVKRPPQDELEKQIKSLGYSGTGRKYGVSDNAIRNWEKWYKKYE